tara:strand:+ start:2353 stop:3210 length:858 start_codon:yes stop_codon:yes gene_type:complete
MAMPFGPVDWQSTRAAIWQRRRLQSGFLPVSAEAGLGLDHLLHVDDQKAALIENTAQFVAGLPANHALLWGSRGSGKSSMVHGVLDVFAHQGLRLVEVGKEALVDLAEIIQTLAEEPFRFLIFCDDLSFDEGDPAYRALKSALEGSILVTAPNVLIYATSNRRHLLPEQASDNAASRIVDGELHHGEAVEEKISLSDRFGLWLSFYPPRQQAYLDMVEHSVRRWVHRTAPDRVDDSAFQADAFRREALQWALARGARNGRSADHFAKHWVGARLLQSQEREASSE